VAKGGILQDKTTKRKIQESGTKAVEANGAQARLDTAKSYFFLADGLLSSGLMSCFDNFDNEFLNKY
jgi:hypothetical protein